MTIYGNTANSAVNGTGSADTIIINASGDTVLAGAGNDVIFLNTAPGAGTIDGGSGSDSLTINTDVAFASGQLTGIEHFFVGAGHAVDFTLTGLQNAGDTGLLITSTAIAGQSDTITGSAFADTIQGGAANDQLYGGAGGDAINGGAGNDGLFGGDGSDTLQGGAGNDYIDGGQGAGDVKNFLYGGAGDDTIRSHTAGDYINGGGGNDAVILDRTGAATGLTVDLTTVGTGVVTASDGTRITLETSLQFYGGAGDDHVVGTVGNDYLNGGAGHNYLDGGAGNDSLRGGDGGDTLMGGGGNDVIRAGNGGNHLYGGIGNDQIYVGTGADTVDAGAGNDKVFWYTGDGAASLDGGAGTDALNLNLTSAEYNNADVRTDLIAYENWIANPAHNGQAYTFSHLEGITANNFESLSLFVDGVATIPTPLANGDLIDFEDQGLSTGSIGSVSSDKGLYFQETSDYGPPEAATLYNDNAHEFGGGFSADGTTMGVFQDGYNSFDFGSHTGSFHLDGLDLAAGYSPTMEVTLNLINNGVIIGDVVVDITNTGLTHVDLHGIVVTDVSIIINQYTGNDSFVVDNIHIH